MADSTDQATSIPTPPSTLGFGARESADETRQAQQQVANDAPVDVNPNAILAREQAATVALAGREFTAASARRNNIADDIFHARSLGDVSAQRKAV